MGLIAGLHGITFSIAISSLLFAGPLRSGLPLAAGATLLCTVVLALTLATRSQLPANIAHAQDVGVAVLATSLATMASGMSGSNDERLASAFAVVACSSLLTGVVFWVTGRFGLGRLVKFFPQPVLSGFLAGTGWLLVKGGVALAVGFRPRIGELDRLVETDSLRLLAPAVALAALVFAAMHRRGHPALLLGMLGAGFAAFFAWLSAIGKDLGWARAEGFVPETTSSASFDLPIMQLFDEVRWSEVAAQVPTMASVAAVCLFAALLNNTALERVTGRDIEIDAELRVTGLANLVVGVIGAAPGYVGVSMSLLAHKAGIRARGAGVVSAVVVAAGFLVAGTIVAHVPNFLPACLVMYLGVNLIMDSLVRTARTYSTTEWLTVLAIVVIVALSGFIVAVVVGLVVSTVLFVYSYARVPVVRFTTTVAEMPSTMGRSSVESNFLEQAGRAAEVVRLQGFVFFGTADQVVSHVRTRLNDESQVPLHTLIVDFTHVSNIDSASAASLQRTVALGRLHGFEVFIAGANPPVTEALGRVALVGTDAVRRFATLDLALVAAEEGLLANDVEHRRDTSGVSASFTEHDGDVDQAAALMSKMVRSSYADRERILAAGEPSDSLLIIESGAVAVMRPNPAGHPERLRTMAPGSVVGDVGFGLGGPRTADIVAEGPTTVLSLSGEAIRALERDDPQLAIVLHRMVSRALAEKVLVANRMTDHQKA